ncbi:MAG: OmpP1/FadL family transporter, partial [Planctomycetaceae bacterium]
MLRPSQTGCVLTALVWTAVLPSLACGQGLMISAQGPVNRSMGGAGTAAPLEAIGSLYWNPASITALPSSELGFGSALVLPSLETDSSVPFLGAGSTRAEPGVTAVPTIGWVHQIECSPISVGLGLYGAAGFRTNFPASATNPIFAPQQNDPMIPGGLGRVYSEASFIEIIPTVAYQVTDRLSIGAGPTLTLGELVVDPLLATAPNDADGSMIPRYPSGRGVRTHWGGGIQLGAYYETEQGVHLGATWKSPQWMETFRFQTEDELGLPAVGRFDLDLPMIVSLGAAYSGWENWVFSADLRYLDYENTDGFERSGYNPDFSVAGLG